MIKFIVVFLGLLLMTALALAADPLGGGVGARPLALGNAFVGLADDGSAIFLNPAGLAEIKQLTLTSMYTQPDSDTLFTSLGAETAIVWGGVAGLGYRNRTVGNVLASAETVSITDQDITFLFAKKIREGLSGGAALRLISRGLSRAVTGFENFAASSTALDLGVQWRPRTGLDLGLAARNLNLIFGGAFRINEKATLVLDLNKQAEEPLAQFHFGAEWQAQESFALRAGFDQSPKTASENYNNLTAGFGINYRGTVFDYAVYRQEAAPQNITHYFSLGYVGLKDARSSPFVNYPTPESIAVKKMKQVRYADLPDGYYAKTEIELLATAGLISGFPDGTFRPNLKLTKDEYEKLLAAAKHLPLANAPERYKPMTRAEFAKMLFDSPVGQAAIKRLPELE